MMPITDKDSLKLEPDFFGGCDLGGFKVVYRESIGHRLMIGYSRVSGGPFGDPKDMLGARYQWL